MKIIPILLVSAVVLFTLAGCIVQSLNPYYTEAALCNIPGIAGEWMLLDEGKPQSGKPWSFGSDKVITYDTNGISASVKVVYFRSGETFFLDTIADSPGEGTNRWWTMHLLPVHIVTKVELRGNRLTLTPIDYDWLEKALESGLVRLPHLRQKDEGTVLFTASPSEWMDFLEKYSHDGRVFSDKNAVRLIRAHEDAGKGL